MEVEMPRGTKESYTPKQKRMARHIEQSYKKRGASGKRAASIGWATVNKEFGHAGTDKTQDKSSHRKAAHPAPHSVSAKRSAAAKKAWRTRRKNTLH
jgi:hypothetical protein